MLHLSTASQGFALLNNMPLLLVLLKSACLEPCSRSIAQRERSVTRGTTLTLYCLQQKCTYNFLCKLHNTGAALLGHRSCLSYCVRLEGPCGSMTA